MNNIDLKNAIKYIPPSQLDYQDWVNIGMALKHEGYPCAVWEEWSKNDKRYHPGECAKKWETFNGSSSPVTAGTIIQMAKEHGYDRLSEIRVFDWDDEIGVDKYDTSFLEPKEVRTADDYEKHTVDEIITYLDLMFKPDEYVGYCMQSYQDENDGKYKPRSSGSSRRTAKELIEELKKAYKKHKSKPQEAIREALGDYDEAGGAWIHFNPMDGEGIKNENVTEYRYALVEADHIDIEKQRAIIERMNLPVKVLVYSGDRSLHALVKIDAPNEEIYKKRVIELHKTCDEYGLNVDKQNRNPSRMSRLPGIKRGDKWQHIVDTNIGLKSWEEWKEFIDEEHDSLPDPEDLFNEQNINIELVPEVISGILRQGRKMILTGASKAGKSFLLMELGIAVATGSQWLGFQCMKQKVLYINFELAKDAFTDRLRVITESLRIKPSEISGMFYTLTLRGKAEKFKTLLPSISHKVKRDNYSFVILDPIYKTLLGDENNAEVVSDFCNSLDKLSAETGATIVFCHHHSKSASSNTVAQNRASGSGVFARDPDAIVDLIEISPYDSEGDRYDIRIPGYEDIELLDYAFFMRIESSLREFPPMDKTEIVFNYPVHYVVSGLEKAKTLGNGEDRTRGEKQAAGRVTQSITKDTRIGKLIDYINEYHSFDGSFPSLEEAVKFFEGKRGYSERNIQEWGKASNDNGFIIKKGLLFPAVQSVEKSTDCVMTQQSV